MHVISRRPFSEAATRHPNKRRALEDLYRVLRRLDFNSPDEMRRVFPSLDKFRCKDRWWVLDVGGNHLRVIAFIQFTQHLTYVKYIVTHAEYDRICAKYAKSRR